MAVLEHPNADRENGIGYAHQVIIAAAARPALESKDLNQEQKRHLPYFGSRAVNGHLGIRLRGQGFSGLVDRSYSGRVPVGW